MDADWIENGQRKEIVLFVSGRERKIGGNYVGEKERVEGETEVFPAFEQNFEIVGAMDLAVQKFVGIPKSIEMGKGSER